MPSRAVCCLFGHWQERRSHHSRMIHCLCVFPDVLISPEKYQTQKHRLSHWNRGTNNWRNRTDQSRSRDLPLATVYFECVSEKISINRENINQEPQGNHPMCGVLCNLAVPFPVDCFFLFSCFFWCFKCKSRINLSISCHLLPPTASQKNKPWGQWKRGQSCQMASLYETLCVSQGVLKLIKMLHSWNVFVV